MAGLVALSVDPEEFNGRFSFEETLMLLAFYHQHLGEQYCGFASYNEEVRRDISPQHGLVRPNFEGKMGCFSGTEAIGYCGSEREPFLGRSQTGKAAYCYSGALRNRDEILGNLFNDGCVLKYSSDIEVIANVIARYSSLSEGNVIAKHSSLLEGIEMALLEGIKGSCSLLVLAEEGIYIALSPDGHWPMVIGEQKGAVAVASESTGFSNLGFSLARDLKPGEIVLIKNGKIETLRRPVPFGPQICKFLWVYTAFPCAVINGISVSEVRQKLGAALAQKDIQNGFIPDIVAPVPDSGWLHAIGYLNEFIRMMNNRWISRIPSLGLPILKYPYAGRSYTPPTQERRNLEAHIKIIECSGDFEGKTVVVVDDSVVRGTQIKANFGPRLRSLGFKEVHIRASNPELLSYCPWGNTTKQGETLADRIPDLEERARYLGVESIRYNSLQDLYEAIGLPEEALCVDCALRRE